MTRNRWLEERSVVESAPSFYFVIHGYQTGEIILKNIYMEYGWNMWMVLVVICQSVQLMLKLQLTIKAEAKLGRIILFGPVLLQL